MYVHKRLTKYYSGIQNKETEIGGALLCIGDRGRA